MNYLTSASASLCILIFASCMLSCVAGLRISKSEMESGSGCPPNGITSWGHSDGFGSTYGAMCTVYIYAALTNRTYCTKRWNHHSHDHNIGVFFDWVGGSYYGPPANGDTERMYEWAGSARLGRMKEWQQLSFPGQESFSAQMIQEIHEQAVKKIRDNYFRDKIDAQFSLFESNVNESSLEKVAWHIRRGDVRMYGNPRVQKRYVSNGAIEMGLAELHRIHPLTVVHFFSEGKTEDFASIIGVCNNLAIKCVWHLNEDERSSHYSLATADVLVMTASSFSGTAGILNRGIVLVDKDLAPGSTSTSTKHSHKHLPHKHIEQRMAHLISTLDLD